MTDAETDMDVTFADVFRAALRRRGLSLERVRDRLEAQGMGMARLTASLGDAWRCAWQCAWQCARQDARWDVRPRR
ncbi:hypothetical protein OG292_18220 [Streptomyces sp. NBC_01511]|uniref:hypothetical protein n=1 Tax=Streptomyces sp. NBC_01511 TaxID=2903889 RepID=UPI003863ECAE